MEHAGPGPVYPLKPARDRVCAMGSLDASGPRVRRAPTRVVFRAARRPGAGHRPAGRPASAAASGTWSAIASLNTARFDDTATLLPNGTVLVAGGVDDNVTLAESELYNPTRGTSTATGSMNVARAGQSATLLPDGKVLAAGGASTPSSAELYNPATGTWAATGNLHTNRGGQSATLLPDGHVLMAGGTTSSGSPVASAELYNPATGTRTATGSMSVARDSQDATLLPGGDVLVTAGVEALNGLFAELYTPATGTWTVASGGLAACTAIRACRLGSSATLLGNGNVLVAGGLVGLNSNPASTASAILYNPAANAWSTTGSLNTAREDQTATLLANGQVLLASGVNFVAHTFTQLASAELYTP
jgi:hypothetical protein